MPTSDPGSIAPIINEAYRLQPKQVLDLGCGSGKYGVLLREYLDIGYGRLLPDDWLVSIIGVEGFAAYVNKMHEYVYDCVYIENFALKVEEYANNDLVLLVDSLEHLEVEEGTRVLDTLLSNNRHVIVSMPMDGYFMEQGAVFGNELERHRGHWYHQRFMQKYPQARRIHAGVCNVYSIKGSQEHELCPI